jgi:hypothetical protein
MNSKQFRDREVRAEEGWAKGNGNEEWKRDVCWKSKLKRRKNRLSSQSTYPIDTR